MKIYFCIFGLLLPLSFLSGGCQTHMKQVKKNNGKPSPNFNISPQMEKELKIFCTMDKDKRVLEIQKLSFGGCSLSYTKLKEKKTIASAKLGTQYCQEVKKRMVSRLTQAGFSCQ